MTEQKQALAEYRRAMDDGCVAEPLAVYDSCSWRRVGLARDNKEVLRPCVLHDGQPDITNVPLLRAMVAAYNAMLVLHPKEST